jgi:hypothetical protein
MPATSEASPPGGHSHPSSRHQPSSQAKFGRSVRAPTNQAGQASSGTFVASHFASAALTSAGRSCAIQWPEGMTTSVRSAQSRRIGSARRESIVSQV